MRWPQPVYLPPWQCQGPACRRLYSSVAVVKPTSEVPLLPKA